MPSNAAADPWLVRPRPVRDATLRLFCFPYAGGSASIFHSWPRSLPSGIEVCSIALPGRGVRLAEPPVASLRQLVNELLEALVPHLDRQFAFFGHSMGALLAFELARELRRVNGPAPAHLFVSGRAAPQHPGRGIASIHDLPHDEFIAGLRRLNGTPVEILENGEMLEILLPALRADLALCHGYAYTAGPPLECAISAYGGRNDPEVTAEELSGWRAETRGEFDVKVFAGEHFFLRSARVQLLTAIVAALRRPSAFPDTQRSAH